MYTAFTLFVREVYTFCKPLCLLQGMPGRSIPVSLQERNDVVRIPKFFHQSAWSAIAI